MFRKFQRLSSSIFLTKMAITNPVTVFLIWFLVGLVFVGEALTQKHCKAESPSDDGYSSHCNGTIQCPRSCPKCHLSCHFCGMVYCPKCERVGSVCQDPRFIGGDGQMFYFHGQKDKDFCLVSDQSLHINGHFIGKRTPNRTRDFTWVQSLGILFGTHKLFVGSNRVGTWNSSIDEFVVYFDGSSVALPAQKGYKRIFPHANLTFIRTQDTNNLNIEITGILNSSIEIVPMTKEDSRIHKYGITDSDCFAHLEVNFDFLSLSENVSGVLGQTYRPGYISPVKKGVVMPIMGGDNKFITPSIFNRDCQASKFNPNYVVDTGLANKFPAVSCSSGGNKGSGFVCRR